MELINLLCLLMITGMISCEDKGVIRLVVRVGEDVVLPCSLGPEVNIEPAVFDWKKDQQDVFLYNGGFCHSEDQQFKERVSHFPDQLKNGNASIIIRNIRLSDSGNFSCIFQHPQQQRFHVELVVGIFAKPRVMIPEITEDQALLQCEVRGASPKPQISWIDSDGTILPTVEKLEDSDDLHYPPALMLQTNVTKTGIFGCRVTQQELNHSTEAQISIPRTYDKTVTGSDGVLLGVAIVCLIVVVLCLVAFEISRRMHRRRAMRERLNAINSRKDKQLAVADRRDSGVSSLHSSRLPERHDSPDSGISFPYSSHHPAKAQETRELKLEAEPDEALRKPMEEF